MRYSEITEGKVEDIAGLRPDTVLSVFHGTSVGDALEMLRAGIDGRKQVKRMYPHTVKVDDGRPVLINRGLFVGPNLSDASQFGAIVLKFKVLARNLHHIFPTKDTIKRDDEMWQKQFPKSSKPSVSAYLSGAAWKNEPQALFRGLVSPRAIEKVYVYAERYATKFPAAPRVKPPTGYEMIVLSPEEFLAGMIASGDTRKEKPVSVEPQERVTPEEYLDRMCALFRCKRSLLLDVVKRELENARTFEKQIEIVMSPGGAGSGAHDHPDVPYTAAKRLVLPLLSYFGVEKKPGSKSGPERYYGF